MFAPVFIVLAAIAVAVHGKGSVANCDREYIVQSGDFCNKISASQGVSTYQLSEVNKAVIDPLCDNLFVGETICLGVAGQDCTSVHVVASGDFCAAIAASTGISLDTLLANNPNVNSGCTNLAVGEVLCTANVIIPYTPSVAA